MTPTNLNADTQVQDAANNWWNPLGTDTKYELAAKHGLFTDFSSFPERFPEESILSIYLKEVQPPTPSEIFLSKEEAKALDEIEALKERVKQLEQLERSFYMDICRAYNAGKQCMSDQHEDARNGKEFNTRFVSSHNYFVGEFPTFKTNVP